MLAALPMAAAMPAMAMSTGIENYRPVFECARTEDGREVVVIRRFVRDGRRYALTVEPRSIETRIRPEEWLTSDGAFEKSPYLDALAATTGGPYPIENAGLRHARHAGEGYFLTVDMCPSFKPFEGRFFETLVAHARRDGMPFPVAISISGFWALDHAAEFATLIASQQRGELDITWVNHSYTHRYAKGVPNSENFLLMPHTDIDKEVLRTEQLLIAHGLTPSVFFRFPGLVSDAYLVRRMRTLGLVPLGADAWLAKLQKPKPGSIVLVHGNGNEPYGVHLAKRYLADPEVTWRPLRAAL